MGVMTTPAPTREMHSETTAAVIVASFMLDGMVMIQPPDE